MQMIENFEVAGFNIIVKKRKQSQAKYVSGVHDASHCEM